MAVIEFMPLPRLRLVAGRLWRRRLALAGLAAAAAFAWLAGRFWHPYYGFTKWLQLDEPDARVAVAALRAHPVFVYPGEQGYDGAAYVQIAFHPLLDAPDLTTAIGNVPYRARRILGGALAWLFAGGNPARIASRYAGLNFAVWFALALLLWHVLPVTDARGWMAWAGAMFSAGALHSVRFALTDLLGAALIVAALGLAERGRGRAGLTALALAGLARETALTAVAGFWRGPWGTPRAWLANAGRSATVALPLAAWVLYIRWKLGPADPGWGNLAVPLVAWAAKWREVFTVYVQEPGFRWLNTTTLLAHTALTAQAVWLVRRRWWAQPWWLVGMSGVALMALLGTAVWEGQPGAATRVLLPMGIAFAVLAVRERAGWGWIAAGSLTVFSGILALWEVPHDPNELAAGRSRHGPYVVRLAEGWSGVERERRQVWAWAENRGQLVVQAAERGAAAVQVRMNVRALTPREVAVRSGDSILWRGPVGERLEPIAFPAQLGADGRLWLIFASDAPPVPEGPQAETRALGFAVYDVRME